MPRPPDSGDDRLAWSRPLFDALGQPDVVGEDNIAHDEFGDDIAFLEQAARDWLDGAPGGALALHGGGARPVIDALAAAHRLGFLSGTANDPPPEALAVGIADELSDADGPGQYELTDWGRRGVGVILAAVRVIRRRTDSPGLTADEFRGLLLATLPLLELPDDAEGIIQFEIDPDSADSSEPHTPR